MGFLVDIAEADGYASWQFGGWIADDCQEGTDTVRSAAHRIIEAGQSPVLRDMFQALEQIEGASGPKFSRKSLHILGQAVACRNYEKMTLELVHMVRAAALTAGRTGYEGVFWGMDRAAASAFRAHFAHGAGRTGLVALEEAGVRVTYPDGSFAIRYGRMPILSAFLEFLVSAIGYAPLSEILGNPADPDMTASDVSSKANAVSRAVYDFLGEHLPTVQSNRKLRRMIAFLEGVLGNRFDADEVDDQAIFDFWSAAIDEQEQGDGADFKAYRTVFLAFLRLIELLEDGDALTRFEHMHAIGTDREAGEVDPGEDAYLDATGIAGPDDPLSVFSEPPLDAVKFLNKKETEILSLPAGNPERVRRLILSYLRAETFGVGQFRLIQALRRKASVDEMKAIAEDAAQESYSQRHEALKKVDQHLEKLALAALFAVRIGDAGTGDEVPFDVLSRARKAFESLSRQGFERDRLDQPEIRAAFEAVPAPLADLRERLVDLIELLDRFNGYQDHYSGDRKAFAREFIRLYGGPS